MNQINHLLTSAIVAETADIAKHIGIAIDNATLTDEYLNGENVKLNEVVLMEVEHTLRSCEFFEL